MSSFSRFQKINLSRGTANKKANTSFIVNGLPSILITGPNDQEVQASVVNKQERDMAYIYTHAGDHEDILPIGTTWSAKGLHWLITEEIISICDVDWHKYSAILCNVEIDGHWGYFISSEASYINTMLQQEVLLQTQQKPLLILANSALKIGDKIMIKGRAWEVQEEDILSTPGISYLSLAATTMSKEIINAEENIDKEFIVEHKPTIDADAHMETEEEKTEPTPFSLRKTQSEDTLYVDSLEPVVLSTKESFAVFSNNKVKILKLKTDQIKFMLPFGVIETEVDVKDDNGEIVKYKIKVRG